MEILASLIIACSNLVQSTNTYTSTSEIIKIKQECVSRIKKCGIEQNKLPQRINSPSLNMLVLTNCSDKLLKDKSDK